jgi:hypothetical protein
MAELEIVGLSISIVDDQRLVWADEQQGIKATPETVYRAGSITKLFTATAALDPANVPALQPHRGVKRAIKRRPLGVASQPEPDMLPAVDWADLYRT